jgi:hypothetical protein
MKERPDLNLFLEDLEHPNIHGTYLAAAVVYATVFRRNPADLRYVPTGITPEAGAFLRKIAWETAEGQSK